MSAGTKSAIAAASDAETSQLLVDSLSQDKEVVYLRLSKAQTNSAKARRSQSLADSNRLEIEDRLLSVEFNISDTVKSTEQQDSSAQSNRDSKKKPVSVIDELNLLYSDLNPSSSQTEKPNRSEKPQVRQRFDKLDVNSYQQENSSSELVEMVAAIKRNALDFQKKLESDSDLVGTTTDAIQKTASVMSNVGSRSQKYRKETQLGWMFYIMSFVFISASSFIGMASIQSFGKW